MAEVKWQPLPRLVVTFLLSLFYGLTVLPFMAWELLVKGPRKYFYVKKRDTRPACMEDPGLGQHMDIDLKTGVRIHYVISGPEDAPLMLFVHGFPESWYSWRHQIREFNKDYRCVAFDNRGYGESGKPSQVSDYSLLNMVEDTKELILALGYDDCILVCHDWGGVVAFMLTMKYPDMVKRFIACNIPHGRAFMKAISTSFKQFRMSWYMFFFQLPWIPELLIRSQDFKILHDFFVHGTKGRDSSVFSENDLEAFKYSLSRPGGLTNPINYYRASFRYTRDVTGIDPNIKPPTVMIWGKKDVALSADMAEGSRQYISDFTLHYIEDSGHWVQQEEPKLVNKYMREFLEAKK